MDLAPHFAFERRDSVAEGGEGAEDDFVHGFEEAELLVPDDDYELESFGHPLLGDGAAENFAENRVTEIFTAALQRVLCNDNGNWVASSGHVLRW